MRMNPVLLAAAVAAFGIAHGENVKYQVHGRGWLDYGRIVSAEDTVVNALSPDDILNYEGNTLQSLGAQVTVTADLSDNLEGGFGFGYYKASHALGSGQFQYLTISLFHNFITQSRLTWYSGEKAAPDFAVTVGGFPHIYNPDVKNLGLYMLRGSVYPGILIGGFGDFSADSSKANMLGIKLHHQAGNFSHDLILNNERDIPPTLDWSLAYLAKLDLGAFQVGAGINFYRLVPYNSKLMSPGDDTLLVGNASGRAMYLDIDKTNPLAPDTTVLTMQGTKVGAHFSLSLPQLFGMELPGNPDDLKIYGEAALIGVKNYGKVYANRGERVAMMFGLNLPTWGLLDHLSLEVEHYGAKYRNDLANTGYMNDVAPWTIQNHPLPSAKPVTSAQYGIDTAGFFKKSTDTAGVLVRGTAMEKENVTKDDLKWSLYADKIVSGHIQFVAQIANDHYRPRPVASGLIKSWGGTAEAFASPKDWYYMFRVGYLF